MVAAADINSAALSLVSGQEPSTSQSVSGNYQFYTSWRLSPQPVANNRQQGEPSLFDLFSRDAEGFKNMDPEDYRRDFENSSSSPVPYTSATL